MEARYPGRWGLAFGGGTEDDTDGVGRSAFGWTLDIDGGVILVRAVQATHPFVWVRGGIAHAIPRSEALALRVACGNKDLMAGRLYLGYGEDIAMVVFDEAIGGGYLSLEYEPSVQDFINRFELSLQYTSEWSKTIRAEFGGQAFSVDDWSLMSV